jgi:hypothetical protein
MKTVRILAAIVLLVSAFQHIGAQTPQKADPVEVYYFHFTSRCETCRTVESEAKTDIQNLYGGMVKFQAINLDDDSSKTIAEKLKISGQTLLAVRGNRKVNLTNEGVLYAMQNPVKFKAIIKEKVDKLLDM